MRIEYQIENGAAEIVRCYGADTEVVIPRELHGFPVKKIAAYAFSARKDEEEKEVFVSELSYDLTEEKIVRERGSGNSEEAFWGEETSLREESFYEAEELLAGERVESVIFPDTVEEIGNYIFYGCKALKKLEFSDSLKNIGSGAFTGCGKLNYLKVHLKQGEKTCVKEILGDLWQRIDVEFLMEYREDDIEKVQLVFPEHYEEAVENTPARILFTQHHGTGNNYRQCFYNREMDYRKYDDLFPLAAAQDKIEVLTDMVFDRLMYPCQLSAAHEKMYEDFLRGYTAETVSCLIGREDMKRLEELSKRELWSETGLDEAVRIASEGRKEEILSFLMNERHRLYPKRVKKKFVL